MSSGEDRALAALDGSGIAHTVTAITPFGASRGWPVIADTSVAGRVVSMGAGAHGVAVSVQGDDVIRVLGATVADIADDA